MQTQAIAWGDSLTFDTGFPIGANRSGVCKWLDFGGTNECVYFADVVTSKKIMLFSSTGKLLHTVPLGEAMDSLRQIAGIAILHPDTIVLCGMYNNKIAIVDRTGRCSVVADLTASLHRADGLAYELWPSVFSPFVLGGRACFQVALIANSIDGYHGHDVPHGDEVYRYEWLNRNGPHCVSFPLNKIGDNLDITWGPAASQKDTSNGIAIIDRHQSYACLNGQWFDFSINSPKIRVLDPISMIAYREFTVRSANSEVYREPIMIPKGGIAALHDSVDDRLYNGGFIETIHFDRPTQHYLVVLRHRLIRDAESGKVLHSGYTVQEYDVGFNFIQEAAITDHKHLMPFMLCLTNGTFVLRTEGKRERIRGIHVFDRISFNGNEK
ncbi:MAG: hypothetical protein JSS84_04180 [Bacteroidetes bacterium]|nr:hypothetical protein [Bacteroidota bacterium]